MRKPRRLSQEELAPWVWEMPGASRRGKSPAQEVGPPCRGGRDCGEGELQKRGSSAARQAAPTPAEQGAYAPRSPGPINWTELFGNPNPVEVEVGTGKGLFLLNAATSRPEVNFFGIEVVRKYQLYAATRYAIRKLPNVKTACADAKVVLRDFVTPGSVAAVHVYFPDPWWKKRHRKRRVFTPEFAADAARAIAPGGRLFIASDVEEYFGVMTAILRAMPAFAERPEEADRAAPRADAGFATNFERKALESGGSVWRAVYERTAESVTVAADPVG